MLLSAIIPSYKDPLLQKTIDSLLENSELGDELEIIAVMDGYWPEPQLRGDDRVKIVHLGKNVGMREAINTGVRVSTGKYIMRSDEHCVFGEGFDRVMIGDCKDNWVMTARRYFLDPIKWEIMGKNSVDYEKLKARDIGGGVMKFEGQVWYERARNRKEEMIDETMAMQGSCWVMPRKWWDDVIVELDTKNYGTMYQDSHEMIFKTWKAGGKLMVNKNTWFAHKHVSFPRTHQHSRKDWEAGVKYSYKVWKDYYNDEIRKKWKI